MRVGWTSMERIDYIGLNGGDGMIYKEHSCMHCGEYLKVPDTWWQSWANKGTKICIDCGRKQNRKNDNSEKSKNRHLKRKYNINLEEYNRLWEEQEGCCKICGEHETVQDKSLVVDHNHETNKVRGLLCNDCNSGIGFLKDNITVLAKAIEYLEKEGSYGLHYVDYGAGKRPVQHMLKQGEFGELRDGVKEP